MPDEKKLHSHDLNELECSDKRFADEEKRIRASELLWFLASLKQLSGFWKKTFLQNMNILGWLCFWILSD